MASQDGAGSSACCHCRDSACEWVRELGGVRNEWVAFKWIDVFEFPLPGRHIRSYRRDRCITDPMVTFEARARTPLAAGIRRVPLQLRRRVAVSVLIGLHA